MAKHTIFDYIDELKYTEFCTQEMASRIEYGYPPYKQLCLLTIQHTQEAQVDKDAHNLLYSLQTHRICNNLSVQILGPSKPPVHKIQRIYIREIYLKSMDIQQILTLHRTIKKNTYHSTINFMPGVI